MKIVIAGGGTAGWLSAYIFCLAHPGKHEITVIESSKVGIIGAGEASSGLILDVLSGFMFDRKEIDILDFFTKTDATPKYALHHINWAKNKGSYFAPITGTATAKRTPDYLFNYVLSEFGAQKAYLSSEIGQAYELNRLPAPNDVGVHFDGFKVGEYIKDYLTKKYSVKHIDSVITDITVRSNGNIENIVLENGAKVPGDFFVDCTGFQKVLATKLNIKWKSYKEYLPADRAMPFLVEYGFDKRIKPMTEAEALSSGWMWRTPLSSRRGCGYVYSSDFMSEGQAQAEAEKIMGHPITPIKHIKFDSGRVEEVWKNNCLITGLASSFLEPLEATSIHATIVQVYNFCLEHLTDRIETTATEANIRIYNKNMIRMYENLLNFTSLHYQGGRDDSPFWRHIKENKIVTPAVSDYIEIAKYKIPTSLHFTDSTWGANDLWKWSLAGLDLINKDLAKEELLVSGSYELAKENYNLFTAASREALSSQRDNPFELDLNLPVISYFM